MNAVPVNQAVQAVLAQEIECVGTLTPSSFWPVFFRGGPISASPAEMTGVVRFNFEWSRTSLTAAKSRR
jgi:hypothetical protein